MTPSHDGWKELFGAARESARYANHRMAERYLRARHKIKLETTEFVEYNDRLSGVMRLGVDTYVDSAWKRDGRRILSGQERLAGFSAWRGLVCQVHQGGGRLVRTEKGLVLSLRIFPKPQASTELPLYMPAVERDEYSARILDKIASGVYPLKRVQVRFVRSSKRLKLQLSYARPESASETGVHVATVRLEDMGRRLVVTCGTRQRHLTDQMHRIAHMKEHFAGIHARLHASLGKSRRFHRMRQAFVKAGNFESWAETPLHQLSTSIVDWARSQDAGILIWGIDKVGDFPWHRLRSMCEYKAAEMGCAVQDPELVETEGEGLGTKGGDARPKGWRRKKS